jgi:hypothetical protein
VLATRPSRTEECPNWDRRPRPTSTGPTRTGGVFPWIKAREFGEGSCQGGAAADEDSKMTDTYILDGRIPIPCADFITRARWFQASDRHVAKTDFGDVRVSTVFLGLDRSFGHGPPLLFETMIFGGPFDQDKYQERCSTWEEAEAQHAEAVEVARQSLKGPCSGVSFWGGMPTGVSP